jgi:hypothetical protein
MHEEHTTLTKHNKRQNRMKIKKYLQNKIVSGIIIGIIASIIVAFIIEPSRNFIVGLFSKPRAPEIISLQSQSAIENSGSIATVYMTVNVDFNPPYYVPVKKRIINPNSYNCDMTIKFMASEGFLFSPMYNVHMTQFYDIPPNFELDSNFEYKNVMIVHIKDFPAKFPYDITFSVYTTNPDAYRNKQDVTYEITAIQKVD